MRRMFEREGSATELTIQSIISRDNLKGYLYVEANSMADIQNALGRIQGIYLTKVELVPIPDRPAILKVIPRKNDARPGGWVRVTRGKYKGDLGMVLEVPEIGVDVVKVHSQQLGLKKSLVIYYWKDIKQNYIIIRAYFLSANLKEIQRWS